MNKDEVDSKEIHAQEIIQSQYDGQSGAGYLKFCSCKYGGTESLMDETVHQMLYDWDETGSHVIGLEILNFPLGGFMKRPLAGDLALTQLSEKQITSVMEKFLR
jgi:hypothetical protein